MAGADRRALGFSLASLIQMVEADKRTCTLRVRLGREHGTLSFKCGVLRDVESAGIRGVEAARRVMAWNPHAEVELFDGENSMGTTIDLSATQILLEALARRDEIERQSGVPDGPRPGRVSGFTPRNGGSFPPPRAGSSPPDPFSGPPSRTEPLPQKEQDQAAMRITSLPEILDAFRADVPGFVSTDIVEVESGLSISGGSIDPNFDASVASASYAEVVKSNSRALQLLGMDNASTEDILITTKGTYFLIRMLGSHHYHLLAISRQGNLGLARVIMKRYEPQFLQAIG
jgi:predicted regulator of Ras-like GTPase activity (Roadblock/LC7/MglB family)